MSKSNDAGHFFQTSAALETTSRKEAKAKNKHGKPIKIASKVLAAHADIFGSAAVPTVYIAEAAGEVKRVKLEASLMMKSFSQYVVLTLLSSVDQQARTHLQ